ncbi:MAG TPA: hypothetical protein PKY10_00940 [Lentisphaeria bacterium]|nr:hypothetical protein [Lentisphaeria bacterium]
MEFLLRHYEKMIMGLTLLCLLGGIFLVMVMFGETRDKLNEEWQLAQNQANGGGLVELLDPSAFSAEASLTDTRKILAINAQSREDRKGSLLEPNRYIKCSKPDCMYLISLSSATCPFCSTTQPELGKDAAEGDDSDNDGMPDLFEQRYAFLNPYNPADATQDYDNDGFLNVEEYRAGTQLDDPDSFPPLGNLLRFVKIFRRPLPIVLRSVDEGRSDDKSKWDVSVNVWDNTRRRNVTRTIRVGDKINDFEILDIIREGTGAAAVYQVDICPAGQKDDVYRLTQGKPELNKTTTVQMVYLASRQREHARTILQRFTMFRNVGDEFPLSKRKSTGPIVEHYRLKAADEAAKTVVIELLDQAKGNPVAEITVSPLTPAADFISAGGGNIMGGGEGPMMEGPGEAFGP